MIDNPNDFSELTESIRNLNKIAKILFKMIDPNLRHHSLRKFRDNDEHHNTR